MVGVVAWGLDQCLKIDVSTLRTAQLKFGGLSAFVFASVIFSAGVHSVSGVEGTGLLRIFVMSAICSTSFSVQAHRSPRNIMWLDSFSAWREESAFSTKSLDPSN